LPTDEKRAAEPQNNVMEKVVSLCKRRGFIFQSSEIYGGLNSCWDYGPLGVELKRNVKEAWWREVVQKRDDMVGLDASILMHPAVWKASGHVDHFSDPLVDCKKCRHRFRADHLKAPTCPDCGGDLTEPRQFNLMFKTFMGPVEDDAAVVYLRPETAQGIFVNFKNVWKTSRVKLPFGIAQIGKAFRNEITPGNFTFRTREFEQMEIEYFVKPGTDEDHWRGWRDARFRWYVDHGMREASLRLRDHASDELAHYAKACVDIEYLFPFGWSELEGIANRTDFDLKAHSGASGEEIAYFDEETKEHVMPYVIEPSAGADRGTLAFLVDSFEEEPGADGDEGRTVLRLHPRLAPITVAVFPLVKKDGMPERAREIVGALRDRYAVFYDQSGAIGRRYRRMDEAGTPFGVTVDGDTAKDGTVTLRTRDDMAQARVKAADLPAEIEGRIRTYRRV